MPRKMCKASERIRSTVSRQCSVRTDRSELDVASLSPRRVDCAASKMAASKPRKATLVPHRQPDLSDAARGSLDFSHHTEANTATETSHAPKAARESVMSTAPAPSSTTTYHSTL